jgi:hypothetical protein
MRGIGVRTLGLAFLLFAIFSVTATGQSKSPATASHKKPAESAARTILPIKCVDHDTAAACKSFKELVDAHEERLLQAILGGKNHTDRHISYVCFRPQSDAFSVIDFDIPDPKKYRPPSTINEDLARFADDSHPTNRLFRESEERTKKLIENSIFMDFSDPPAVSQYTKDQWFQDHSKDFVYSLGFVADSLYQDGLYKGVLIEQGEWYMLAGNKGGIQHDPPNWFIGAYAWIERFNRQHGDASAKDDDPEHGHMSIEPSSIHIHYKFKNISGDMVDYTLQIHRLTGRFVEYFKYPDGNDEASGTCMIFR